MWWTNFFYLYAEIVIDNMQLSVLQHSITEVCYWDIVSKLFLIWYLCTMNFKILNVGFLTIVDLCQHTEFCENRLRGQVTI